MLLTYIKNSIEILLLASCFYYFSVWLKKDKEKNLVWYFYCYFFLFITTWYTNLCTLNAFMIYTSPFVAILFVIVHQQILQRNFISIKKEKIPTTNHQDALEEVVRAALSSLNKNKHFYCILEHLSDLRPFIKADFLLKAELKQESISYIIDSKSFDEHKFVWCTTQGQLLAVNTQWKIHQTQAHSEIQTMSNQWKEDAILITSKTDACVIQGNPETRLFELVVNGKLHEKISVHQLLQLLTMQINQSSLPGEKNYESNHKRVYNQQQNP